MIPPRRRRSGARLARIGLLAASLLLSLGVAELVVRALGLVPQVMAIRLDDAATVYQSSSNPILGFELKAGFRSDDADARQTHYRTNAHGQRDVERSLEKPPGIRRILLLGDSVVEGHGILDLEDTLSRRLERLYGDGTEVLNFGVSGYCTRAEVELLETKGLGFAPDIVVLLFVENDFENFNHVSFLQSSRLERHEIVEWLYLKSRLFRLLALQLNLFGFAAEKDPIAFNNRAIGGTNVVEGLARLRELRDRHDFEVLVAVWPRFTEDGFVDPNPIPDESGELVVERLARSHGFPVVRLSHSFAAHRSGLPDLASPRAHYSQGDGMHPSTVGCRVAAVALQDQLARLPELRAESAAKRPTPAEELVAVEMALALGTRQPDWARIHGEFGVYLIETGNPLAASRHLRVALEITPDDAELRRQLGVALAILGDFDGALIELHRALELEPDSEPARRSLRSALQRKAAAGS